MPLLPARLAALPRRGKPCALRPYHRPRDYHNLLRFLPSFSSSSSFSFSSSSSSTSPWSSLLKFQRIAVAACGVRAHRCRAPLFFRTHPPPLQDFINRASYSTRGAMATKIDGTAIAKNIRAGLKAEIEQIQQANPRFKPSLVIFQGTSSACYQYRPN